MTETTRQLLSKIDLSTKPEHFDAAMDMLEDAEARIKVLEAALEPFAKAAAWPHWEQVADDHCIIGQITFGVFRRARSAHEGKT